MEKEKLVITFLTKNQHKFNEAKEALKPCKRIQIIQLAKEKQEYKDDSLIDPIKQIHWKPRKKVQTFTKN